MPLFEYTAFDKKNNKKVQGELDLASVAAVREDLAGRGLFVISVTEKKTSKSFSINLPSFKRVPWKEMAGFFKSLSLSVKAGVSLAQVFEVLVEQAQSAYFKEILTNVHAGITKGRTLSECFKEYPKVFPHNFISLVEGGEQSGKLAETLEEYSSYVEERQKMRAEILGALAYPAIIILVAIVALLILTLHIFPTFMKALGLPIEKLPWITQFVYGFSTFVLTNWKMCILGVPAILFAILWFFNKTKKGQDMAHWGQLNLPVINGLFKRINIATFARTMALQSKAGVASVASLELTKKSLTNRYYKELTQDIIETIKKGGTYLDAMKQKPHLVTPLVTLLITVGEQTGTFDEVLETIAAHYNDEVKATIAALTSMIEPLMIVGMGCLVGVITASMFLPLFDLVSLVK